MQAAESLPIADFLKVHTAYDLLPDSGKVVVVDVGLTISSAFLALQENGITSAPLWDSNRQEYVGMLTVTDFIEIILDFYYRYSREEFARHLETYTLREWRKRRRDRPALQAPPTGRREDLPAPAKHQAARIPLIFVHPEASLFDASRVLLQHRIHRGPVLDPSTNTVLHVITHARILRYLVSKWRVDSPILNRTLRELNIGTYQNIIYVSPSNKVAETLSLLAQRRISAVPVVNGEGVVIGVYSMSDVRHLLLDDLHSNLELTVDEALSMRTQQPQASEAGEQHPVYKCTRDDTLKTVFGRLATYNVHRLVVVDEASRLVGIVSVNDILRFFTAPPSC
ncbi:putative 5'-AMP-activated protein kinase subunit gamma-2 [Paratrimastix pyriformis]|uniref:5'-AMP-activated protein kinase subunit gamma-2 n=1 Tax=Paratrimastix pyriformis TaxID=342808 RepID=A0ABQ8U7W1_9EUKA|nr:putative 5'-AMP-activated protein kinase subunit gamma-2 [Paratrimastix pyriformis]